MKILTLLTATLMSSSAWAWSPIMTPEFPTGFPEAQKKLGKLQPAMQKMGNQYCEQIARAETLAGKVKGERETRLLQIEVVVGSNICQKGEYLGFAQTPDDENLKLLTDISLLRYVSLNLYAATIKTPEIATPAIALAQRLQNFEQVINHLIHEAYSTRGSQSARIPFAELDTWVRDMHRAYSLNRRQ